MEDLDALLKAAGDDLEGVRQALMDLELLVMVQDWERGELKRLFGDGPI